MDYCQLNEATLPDVRPLPLIESMLKNQSKHKIFTIVDLSKGFHQISLHPEPRAQTAMNFAGEVIPMPCYAYGYQEWPCYFSTGHGPCFTGFGVCRCINR